MNDSSYFIIVTRGHKDDMRVLRWVVMQPARYLGMIGSKRKTIEVVKHLRREGIPVEKFAKLHAPMGFDIGAVTPEEIAVSVVAEMIQRRRKPAAEWNPLSKSIFAEGIPKAVQIEPLAAATPGQSADSAQQTALSDKSASASAE